MKRIRNGLTNKQTELRAVVVFLLLSMIAALSGFRYYQNYRRQAISMEGSQLLTIAGIVGDNLDSYLEQKIHQIDLIFGTRACQRIGSEIMACVNERTSFCRKTARCITG